jgi:hypothetical protein
MHLKRLFILLCLSHAFSIYSQTPWLDCCRGYENGYKKGYSYPDLNMSSTVVAPPCNCATILGTLNYEVGYIKGYEDGRNARESMNQNRNTTPQHRRYEFNDYIPDPTIYYSRTRPEREPRTKQVREPRTRIDGEHWLGKAIKNAISFFPGNHLGWNRQLNKNYNGFYWGLKHDFSRRISSEIGVPLLDDNLGFMFINDYNFNKRRPNQVRGSRVGPTINPTLGLFISNINQSTNYGGSAGLEFFFRRINSAYLGFNVKYFQGINDFQMIQGGLSTFIVW